MRRYRTTHRNMQLHQVRISLDRFLKVWFGAFVSKATIPLAQTQLSSQLQTNCIFLNRKIVSIVLKRNKSFTRCYVDMIWPLAEKYQIMRIEYLSVYSLVTLIRTWELKPHRTLHTATYYSNQTICGYSPTQIKPRVSSGSFRPRVAGFSSEKPRMLCCARRML